MRIPRNNKNANDAIKRYYIRWIPMLAIQGFLLFTLLAYRFGPWKYATQSDNRVVWFALAYQLALLLGYAVGSKIFVAPADKTLPWKKLLAFSLLANILLFIPTTYARTGDVIPNVVLGIVNSGEAYSRSLDAAQTGTSVAIEYIRILFAPLLYAYFPLCVFYWSSISGRLKTGSAIVVLLTIALYVSMGTNKAIGEFAILLPLVAFASFLSYKAKTNVLRRTALVSLSGILLVTFFSFFTTTQKSRSGSGINVGYFPPGNTRADLKHPSLMALPEAVRPGALAITNYTTQGYFALGLALDEPFNSMYGFGSSTFVSRQVSKFTGNTSFEDLSYPAKIERYGWDRYVYWSSIYLWIASDISLYGVGIFCFIVGLLFVYSWRDAVEYRSPLGVIMLSLNLTALLYFTSNNQIGQSGELLMTYSATLLLWAVHRSRVRIKIFGGIYI